MLFSTLLVSEASFEGIKGDNIYCAGVTMLGLLEAHAKGVENIVFVEEETHLADPVLRHREEAGVCPSYISPRHAVRRLLVTCGREDWIVKIWDYAFIGDNGSRGRSEELRSLY